MLTSCFAVMGSSRLAGNLPATANMALLFRRYHVGRLLATVLARCQQSPRSPVPRHELANSTCLKQQQAHSPLHRCPSATRPPGNSESSLCLCRYQAYRALSFEPRESRVECRLRCACEAVAVAKDSTWKARFVSACHPLMFSGPGFSSKRCLSGRTLSVH